MLIGQNALMSEFTIKVYVAQRVDARGRLGEVLAIKLTHAAAHAVAKAYAPAAVNCVVADKTTFANMPAQISPR